MVVLMILLRGTQKCLDPADSITTPPVQFPEATAEYTRTGEERESQQDPKHWSVQKVASLELKVRCK